MLAPAMTLVETMVGMAILGTLLVSLIVARAHYLKQWSLAGRKQEAIQTADALLAQWWADPQRLPRQAIGQLPQAQLQWKTHLIKNPPVQKLGAEVVRLEIFDLRLPAGIALGTVLASVDVVLNPSPHAPPSRSRNDVEQFDREASP